MTTREHYCIFLISKSYCTLFCITLQFLYIFESEYWAKVIVDSLDFNFLAMYLSFVFLGFILFKCDKGCL